MFHSRKLKEKKYIHARALAVVYQKLLESKLFDHLQKSLTWHWKL